MTPEQAEKICEELGKDNDTLFDHNNSFVMDELLKYLVKTTNNPGYAVWIGNTFIEKDKCDLALYYFEKAIKTGYEPAYYDAGRIYRKGYSSKGLNYKKAFEYFDKCSKSKEVGDGTFANSYTDNHIKAYMEMAKMYRNGEYVEQDYTKYKKIVFNCYEEVKDKEWWSDRKEVEYELSKIYLDEKDFDKYKEHIDNCIELQLDQINNYVFIDDLYQLERYVINRSNIFEPDNECYGYPDLFYLLKKDCCVIFEYENEIYVIQSYISDNPYIKVNNKEIYRDVVSMLINCKVGGQRMIDAVWDIEEWRIIE